MSARSPALGDKFWERLRYRGAPMKKHVLSDLPDSGTPLLSDRLWQSFKQHCAVEGNLVPLLISQLEPQECDPVMFPRRRPRTPKGSDPFGDLMLIQRLQAEEKFQQLCEKWAGNLPSWRRAILVGVARRLTLHPPNSDLGQADAAHQRRGALSAEIPGARLASAGGVQSSYGETAKRPLKQPTADSGRPGPAARTCRRSPEAARDHV